MLEKRCPGMDASDVLKIWEAGTLVRERMCRVKLYYDGEVKLRELEEKRLDGRAKSKVLTNWTKYASRLHAGLMTGHAATYSHRDGAESKALAAYQDFADRENLAAADSEHYRNAFLYGYSAEIHSFEAGQARVQTTWPWDWVFVTNERGEIVKGLHRQAVPAFTELDGELVKKDTAIFRLYTATEIITYKTSIAPAAQSSGNAVVEDSDIDESAGALVEFSRIAHNYGRPPVVVFRVSEDAQPFLQDDFLKQCDAYDITRSAMQDDIKHAVDSLLMTKGLKFEKLLERDKDGKSVLAKLREDGFFPLPENAEANYLTRTVDVEKFKADLKVTRASIHLMACIPDLDETIGGNEGTITNISGVGLKLMFHLMLQAAAEMEKHFKVGLRKRVEVWNRVNWAAEGLELTDFTISMTVNLPFNEAEIVQYLPNLEGVLSTEDRIKLLPFVDSPARAAANLRKEQESATAPLATSPNNSEAIA